MCRGKTCNPRFRPFTRTLVSSMLRVTATALLSLAFVAPVSAAEPTPLSELKLDLDRLKTLVEQKYTYEAKAPGGQENAGAGTVVFATVVKGNEVLLQDKMKLTHRGNELSLDLIHHCRKDNYLSPTRIESQGEGDDEVATFTAVVQNGKAKVEIEGRERVIELPPDTVSFSALIRLLPLLPQEQGLRISFPYWLESSELHLKQDFVIECLGQEEIHRNGQRLPCTKYRLTSDQIRPMDAWVDRDRVLQRVLIDERKVMDLMEE